MDGVVFHSHRGRITGALIDTLDYFAALRLAGCAVRLDLVRISPQDTEILLKDRYQHAPMLRPHIYHHSTGFSLLKLRYGRVLTAYSGYKRLRFFLRARRIYILPSQVLRHDFLRRRIRQGPNTTFLLDPQQHPYPVREKLDYQKRVFLGDLPVPARSNNAVLVNMVSAHKRHRVDILNNAIERFCPGSEALALSYRRKSSASRIRLLRPPVENFFSRFDHYLYLPSLEHYDENPRLILEATWLGKKVTIAGDIKASDPAGWKAQRARDDPENFCVQSDDLMFSLFSKPD